MKSDAAFSFENNSETWWCQIKKYPLNSKINILIGVIIPEKDIVAEMKSTKNTIIIGFVLVIIMTIITVYYLQQQRKANLLLQQRNEEILQQKEEIEAQNEHILQQKEEIETQRDILETQNEELKQAKEEIEAQRDEIESQRDEVLKQRDFIAEQNREITDSIKYAKRIQRAILPTEDFRNKLLKEHFVLFKPLNIVSGDFYWITFLEGKTIITVADCTGHGVPGAFMSMLGAAFLNEIVNKEYITHTGVILRRLRKQVIKALQQSISEEGHKSTDESSMALRDGMDIALCSIDMDSLDIQFSGANNSLYLIRDKNNDFPELDDDAYKTMEFENKILYEIKPDKMPIAIYEKMDRFKTVEFKLFEGDVLYMFSDGFADQFGGPKGKKFMYKNFKKLLLQVHEKPMNEQLVILDNTIEDWKNHINPENNAPYEQVDDICIIGFRI
ncbi:MAG: hypothetical protein Kow0068_19210 [Marinilabiliales bacterium]